MKNLRTNNLIAFCMLVAMLFFQGLLEVHAQTVPGSADTSRFKDRFDQRSDRDQGEQITPPKDMDISSKIPEAVDGFLLKEVDVQGVTAFPVGEFDSLINEYIGRSVDLNVLSHLSARITAHYRENGYFLSVAVVPQQEISDGVVIIQVIEGHVDDVILNDPQNLLGLDVTGITQKTIKKIKSLKPLHGPSLERYMLLLNEGMNVFVSSILGASSNRSKPGGIIVTLNVEKSDDEIRFGYNNFGSRFVGPHQADFFYATGGFYSPYDQLTVQATTSIPLREVQFGSIAYELPLTADGLRLNTELSYSNSEPGLNLKTLEVESDSTSFDVGLTYPVIRSRRTNLIIGSSLLVRNSATEFLGEELTDDKVRSLVLDADYNTQSDDGDFTAASFALYKGLDFLGATQTGANNLSRAQGRSDYFKITANAAHVMRIPDSFFNVLAQVEGQYAPHPLLSSAEFGYGGSSLGRAYDPSEITGDQGVAGGFEVRYTGIEPLDNRLNVTPFAFYDIGKVWNEDRDSKPVSAASAGLGAYYQVDGRVNGSVALAYPLTKTVDTPVMGGKHGPRILFEITADF